MHPGAFARANDGVRKQRVVPDIAKLSVGREAYCTRELATDHEQYPRSAVPAFDVVLRPTKSVSVLYEEEFAEAVTMTLDTTMRLALPD